MDTTSFLRQVEVGSPNECWIWKGAIGKDGYGRTHLDGQMTSSNRAAYRLFIGEIQKGMYVLHTCDNRLCVNPAHLYEGTPAQNMQDMLKSGRQRNGKAKILSPQDIKTIRELFYYDLKNYREISVLFNTSPTTIGNIIRGKSWNLFYPVCMQPPSCYVVRNKGYFLPLCLEHSGEFPELEHYPISNLAARLKGSIPGCSFVKE